MDWVVDWVKEGVYLALIIIILSISYFFVFIFLTISLVWVKEVQSSLVSQASKQAG
jgi:hypothetical protein